MAKVGLLLRGATGKLAGMTLQKGADGSTIARETVTPKNPNTDAQKIQRTIIATVGKAYGIMRKICDHSFEGYSNGAACMNRFRKLNARNLRESVAAALADGTDPESIYDFTPVGAQRFALNPYIISSGSLDTVNVVMDWQHNRNELVDIPVADAAALGDLTYQDVCDGLGLKKGDQLTFVFVVPENNVFKFKYARVILSPSNGDMLSQFVGEAVGGVSSINDPNERNEGSVFFAVSDGHLTFTPSAGAICGAVAVIASRKQGNAWLRSAASLILSEDPTVQNAMVSLYDAIANASSYIDSESPYYLNNAQG